MAIKETNKETSDKDAAARAVADGAAAAKAQCAASSHLWVLPDKNPFNSASLECSFSCRRCGAAAKMSIVVGG